LPYSKVFEPGKKKKKKMKKRAVSRLGLLCWTAVLSFQAMSTEVSAQPLLFQWGAMLTASEQYDDNIGLRDVNREYDWITFITPGLRFSLTRGEIEAALLYEFSLVQYARFDSRSTTRHALTLSVPGMPVAERFTLDLDEVFRISEDPLGREGTEDVPSVRRGRGRYYANSVDARINYVFGPEDLVYLGFVHRILNNEDPRFEDSQEFLPSAGFTNWFSVHYGCTFDYSYGKAEFDVSDDYQRHLGIASFLYRVNPKTETSLSYSYDHLDYSGQRVDYDVHEIRLGFSHEFSSRTTGALTGGYYIVVPEEGDNRGEPTGSVTLTHTASRSTFTLDGAAGYRRQAIQAENFGLSFFSSATIAFTYQPLERLSTALTGSYFRDEFQETVDDRVDTNWRGTVAFDYLLLRWLTGSLLYEYRKLDSNIEGDRYDDNRVTINFTATYSGRGRPL